jgi:hypothetical protein
MTLKQKQNAERPWLRQELLVVTKELASLLESSNLSEEEKRHRALVQHIIVRESEDLGFYHNIHTDVWKGFLGNNYSTIVEWLEINGHLKVNPSYCTDPLKPHSMSYRIPGLTENNRDVSLTAKPFTTSRIQRFIDDSKPTDAVSKFVLDNLKQLTVRKQLVHIDNIERRALALEYCKWVYNKRFNVRYGQNSNRLSHTVIRMVKEARVNLILDRTLEDLHYFDITACYPNLLPYWARNPVEKQYLVQVLQSDFYGVLISYSNTTKSRDEVKRIVSKFLCDPDHPSNNVMGKWLETNCPNLFEFICSMKSMALDLQNLESDIFVERLGNWALLHQKWFVPMHDGFLCRPNDSEVMRRRAESVFESVVGHKPPLKLTVLNL